MFSVLAFPKRLFCNPHLLSYFRMREPTSFFLYIYSMKRSSLPRRHLLFTEVNLCEGIAEVCLLLYGAMEKDQRKRVFVFEFFEGNAGPGFFWVFIFLFVATEHLVSAS